MKRKISAALSIILLLGLLPMFPINNTPIKIKTAYAQSFPDVREYNDCYDAVENLYSGGIVSGFEDGDFHPDYTVTRAQVAKMIVSAMGEEELAQKSKNSNPFNDVPDNHWAVGYIAACSELGILSGMGNGTFAPDDNVTYQQMYKIVVCMDDREEDAMAVGGWPTGYWNTAHFYGYTSGLKDSEIDDEGPALRGHVAILFNNVLYNFGNRISENKIEYVDGTEFIQSTEKVNTLISKDKNGAYYEFKNPDDTLKNLESGDIFVIEPCDLVPAGLAVKVKSMSKSGGNIRIYRDDLAFEEVVEDIDIAESVPVSLENITPAEGVSVETMDSLEFVNVSKHNSDKPVPMLLAASKGGVSGGSGLQFKIKYNNNGFKINGTVKLLNPTFSVDIRSINNIDFKVDTVSSIDVEISKTKSNKETFRQTLGSVTVPIGTTGLFGKYEVFLDFDVKGSAKVSVEEKMSGGFKIQGKNIMPIKSVKNSTSVNAEASITVTGQLGMDVAVSLLEVLSVGLEGGAGVEVTAKNNTAVHECTLCLDGDIAPFMKIGVYAELGIGRMSYRPVDIPVTLKGKVNAFYISWRNNKSEFGFGDCPYVINSQAQTTNVDKTVSTDSKLNGAGNFINNSFATSNGKYIYYSSDGCLWRTDLDGNNKVKITDGTFEDIIVDSDNKMVYATKDNGLLGSSVHRVKDKENSKSENLTGRNYSLIGIYDGYLYYYGENSDIVTDAHICKKPIDSDDWNGEKVLQDCTSVCGMYDSKIYYLSDDDKLYALDLDNENTTLIYDDYFKGYNFVNDKIYFADSRAIYCMDLNGKNIERIYSEETIGDKNNFDRNRIETINIVGDTIYYVLLHNNNWEICKVDINGNNRAVVNDDWVYSLCIAGGKFFGRSSMNYSDVRIEKGTNVSSISNNTYKIVSTYGDYSAAEKDGKIGIVDNNGKIIVPFEYDTSLGSFTRGWDDNFKKGYFILSKDDKYGVIDKNGKIIVPFKYFHVYGSTPPYLFEADKTMVGTMGSQSEYVDYYDKNGKIVTKSSTINEYFGEEAIMRDIQNWLNDSETKSESTPKPTKTPTPKPTQTPQQSSAKDSWYPTCPSCGETDMFIDPSTGLYICRNCDYIEPEFDGIIKCDNCGSYDWHVIEKSGYFYVKCYSCGDIKKYKKTTETSDNSNKSGPHCPNCGSGSFTYSTSSGNQFVCNDCGTKY